MGKYDEVCQKMRSMKKCANCHFLAAQIIFFGVQEKKFECSVQTFAYLMMQVLPPYSASFGGSFGMFRRKKY